jgi:selenium metabolism protein YedF
MYVIDARGLDCPKPVIKTKEAVDKGSREFAVWVDNDIAASNVTRYLEGQGYDVRREDGDSTIVLNAKLQKESGADSGRSDDYGVLLTSDMIGAESGGLGEVLMKSYLGTLAQKERPPVVVALMNRAVFMATDASSALSALTELADRGSLILVCGTCVKHFGIMDELKIGVVSNMFEITEAVFGTPKPIVIG